LSIIRLGSALRFSIWFYFLRSMRLSHPPSFQSAELLFCSGVMTVFEEEDIMGLGRGALLWMLGVPLPIVLLLALFWNN
jgi:hypothetical protein